MIRSFRNSATEQIFNGHQTPDLPADIQTVALRKLLQIANARQLSDLRVPPGNHLEELKGDRKGQHSIRINKKYRACFVWNANGVLGVEIVDYH